MTNPSGLALEFAPEPFALLLGDAFSGQLSHQNRAFRDQLGESTDLVALVDAASRDALYEACTAARQGRSSAALRFTQGALAGSVQTVTFWAAGDSGIAMRIDGPAEPSAEAVLDSKAQVLAWALEQIGGTLWVIRRDGTITLSEGPGLAHYGLKPGQIKGLNAFQIYPKDSDAYASTRRCLDGETLHEIIVEDSVVWDRFSLPFRDEHGQVMAMVGLAAPIPNDTQRVRHAEQLLNIVNQLPLVVWAMKVDGTCTLSAGKYLSSLGFSPGELVGKNIFEVYKDASAYTDSLREALKGEPLHTQQDIGDQVWTTDYFPSHDALGAIGGIYAITQNITERARAERERIEQLALIQSQKTAIATLVSPIIEVWQGVLVVPLIGGIGEDRASIVTSKLLDTVVARAAQFAILDLTGVDAVDAATAEHILGIMRSVALLGSTCLVSGIRPNVAATMVGLGVEVRGLRTYPTLAQALRHCLRTGELR